MTAVPARPPSNEKGRLAAVHRTGLMGSTHTARFDIYTRLFRHVAQVPVAYTGLIDEARQYFLSDNFTGCMTGVGEVAREKTICQHALLSSEPIIVPDMRAHPTFAQHPLIAGDPYWVFWAGFPLITAEGYVLGTLCAVDFEPRTLDTAQIDLMRGIAADMALTIQLQADQQERIAVDCAAVLAALDHAGVKSLVAAQAFLDLCMERPVDSDRAKPLVAAGLVDLHLGEASLTAAGATIRTGHGLGPAHYKHNSSPIHDADLLDAMFNMID